MIVELYLIEMFSCCFGGKKKSKKMSYDKIRLKIFIRILLQMKANLNKICEDMSKNPRNAELQMSCLMSLYQPLKDEKDTERFQNAFKTIDNTLKANANNSAVILQVLNLFGQIVQIRALSTLLEATNIFSQLMYILSLKKEDSEVSEVCLSVISRTIALPKMASHFSSQNFIKSLVFLTRLNSKSLIHASYITSIALYINPRLEMALKDLCLAFIVLSRNFPKNELLQEKIITGFAQMAGSKIMTEIASIAIPQFTDIALRYPKNINFIRSFLFILCNSPENEILSDDYTIIMNNYKQFKDDSQAIQKSIEFFTHKMDPKQIPVEALPLVILAIETFLTNTSILKQTLTIGYYATSSSSDDDPIPPKLIQLLTSVLLLHSREASITRRSAAIIHVLSSNQNNDTHLYESSAPYALLQAFQANIKDHHCSECISAALSNFVSNNTELASQISTEEHFTILKQACKIHRKDLKILKSAILIMKALVLSKYDFYTFIDLPIDKKKVYFIDQTVGSLLLQKQLSNQDLAKAVLLLMPPSPEESSLISLAMIKYSKDEEIQYAGLLHNITDVSAINRALLTCGENAFKYAYESLQKIDDILPPQTISFLLSLNRFDAIDLLLIHISRQSASAIAAQFKLNFLEQIVIADALAKLHLWEPTESDYTTILTSLYHSIFDQRQLLTALTFAQKIGLTESSFPLLIDAIKRYPTNKEIVGTCAEFISALPLSKQVEVYCFANDAVSIAAFALEFNKSEESIVYPILKMINVMASYESLIKCFSQSSIISMISGVSDLSDRCAIESTKIYSNLIEDKECAYIMKNYHIDTVVFEYFSAANYKLMAMLMEETNFTPSEDQYSIAIEHLNQLGSNVSEDDTYFLLQIILKRFERDENPVHDLEFKCLIPILTVYSSNEGIVQTIAHLVGYSDDYKNSKELLFALMDALKSNYDSYDTVIAIFMVLREFYSISKHLPFFKAQQNIELFRYLLSKYPSDVTICSFSLKVLQKIPISLDLCNSIMKKQSDIEVLISLSEYFLSVCQDYDLSTMKESIFEILSHNIENITLLENLIETVYYFSNNESTHLYIVKNIDVIISVFLKYTSSNNISLGFLGILSNITAKPINLKYLTKYAHLIGVAMRNWINENQIQRLGSNAICHFAMAGKGSLFFSTLPVLEMALKLETDIESTCQAIIHLVDSLGELSGTFADDIITIFSRDKESIPFCAGCLQKIVKNKAAEDVVFNNLSSIFSLIEPIENDMNSATLLDLCASLKNPAKLILFGQYINQLMNLINQPKIRVATSAANCLLNLAKIRPEIVEPYADEIIRSSQKSSGELLRVFLQLKNVLFGLKSSKL